MALPRRDDELVAKQGTERDRRVEFVGGPSPNRKVQRLVPHQRQEGSGKRFHYAYADQRKLLAETGNSLGHEKEHAQRPAADRNRTQALAAELSHLLLGLAELGLGHPRPGEEGASRGGRHDAMRRALHELRVQLGFETANALGYRRLRHAQLAGGTADAARLN